MSNDLPVNLQPLLAGDRLVSGSGSLLDVRRSACLSSCIVCVLFLLYFKPLCHVVAHFTASDTSRNAGDEFWRCIYDMARIGANIHTHIHIHAAHAVRTEGFSFILCSASSHFCWSDQKGKRYRVVACSLQVLLVGSRRPVTGMFVCVCVCPRTQIMCEQWQSIVIGPGCGEVPCRCFFLPLLQPVAFHLSPLPR